MTTYLIQRGRIFRTWGGLRRDEDEGKRSAWRLSGDEAVHEFHYRLEAVEPPPELEVYSHCEDCERVLVRTNRNSFFGDIVYEHELFVEYSLKFPSDGPMTAERVTGDRAALMDELRENVCACSRTTPRSPSPTVRFAARDVRPADKQQTSCR